MRQRVVVARLVRLLLQERGILGLALGLVTAASLFQPLRPYLYRYVIDYPLREGNISALIGWGIALMALTSLHALTLRWQTLTTQKLSWGLTQKLRQKLFAKVLRLSIPTIEKYPSGMLYTRTLTDTQTLQNTLAETLLVIAGELIQLTFLVGLMFMVDPILASATLVAMPLGLLTSRYFAQKIRESFGRVRLYIARMNGYLNELLQSRETTESLGANTPLWQRFLRLNTAYYLSYRRVIGYFALFFPAMELVTLFSLAAVLLIGSYLIYKGESTIGALVAFTLYQQLFFRPFRIIADQVNSLQMGIVSAERIFRLLDLDGEEASTGQVPTLPPPYTIEIKDVRFSYTPDKPLLENLHFTWRPGQVYGLIAPTGRGKSTLFYLLLGYYSPQAGEIRIGGLPISAWDKQKLRALIAYIPQEPVLFEGTLRENLTLYEAISDAELEAAAHQIGIGLYVQKWSLDMPILAGGGGLSAGEKQLIALWRAALRRPAVWILDEPTAHIDPSTERFIYSRLQYLAQNAVVLVVAHRPEAHAFCDEIIALPAPSHAA
ncbi:MAG: ABC transporter ATP-binding protein/permease [Bacteroidia bacterium]|nr:ABC transporter ATP-binding protein/permease [Bacteroidia bacterium]GIV24207.1 MAG: ABC transporter ATP-binding protein [Bacteroidia bacterium]